MHQKQCDLSKVDHGQRVGASLEFAVAAADSPHSPSTSAVVAAAPADEPAEEAAAEEASGRRLAGASAAVAVAKTFHLEKNLRVSPDRAAERPRRTSPTHPEWPGPHSPAHHAEYKNSQNESFPTCLSTAATRASINGAMRRARASSRSNSGGSGRCPVGSQSSRS